LKLCQAESSRNAGRWCGPTRPMASADEPGAWFLARIFHELPGRQRRRTGSAGFSRFRIGTVSPTSKSAGCPPAPAPGGFGNPRYSPDSESGEVCATDSVYHSLSTSSFFAKNLGRPV
jgi:hypothetical protein